MPFEGVSSAAAHGRAWLTDRFGKTGGNGGRTWNGIFSRAATGATGFAFTICASSL